MNADLNFRQDGKIVIALSGAIASGKTAALEEFAALGAETICADTLAAKYRKTLKEKLKSAFGTDDKEKLTQLVFKDAQKLKELENMIHPLVLKEAGEIIKTTPKKIIVFAIPLLFEKGLEGGFDLTVCVYASYQKRFKRALSRGTNEFYFKRCDETQLPMVTKAERADIIIFNEGTRSDLRSKITRLYETLKK